MSARLIWKLMLGFYIALFFSFLFGPLAIMGVTAFNTPDYPQVWPFEGFTLDWFVKLAGDRNLTEGLINSLIIGAFVVVLSVPLGLAGAIVVTQIYSPARSLYYLVVVSPILTPGVIIGISTVIFWKDVADLADVNKHTLKEIQHFFETYKELNGKGDVVTINGFKGKVEAQAAFERACRLYQDVSAKGGSASGGK